MEEDLSVFLEGEFSSISIINEVELSGIFNEEHSPAFDGSTEGDRITFLVSTAQARKISYGDSVEIDDRNFRVRGKEKIDDGIFTELVLKEVT